MARGYSGNGVGKNNPNWQKIKDEGPIPQGTYTIGDPVEGTDHGPYALPLIPDPSNEMYGRSGFLIHGDEIDHPGCASRGCIILPRFARERIIESGDHGLQVVSGWDSGGTAVSA
jgi:hypothetical protein